MFESLTQRLEGILGALRGRGALTEADVHAALRDVRVALLEADVALPVAKDFIEHVKTQAVGQNVIASVTPGQMVVKIVYDQLVAMLGASPADLITPAQPPAVVMMVGLQGTGKTTTTAKLGKWLTAQQRKKVLMASLDVARPAAQHQLEVLGTQTQLATLPIVAGEGPLQIAQRAYDMARKQSFDVLLLDTAGRLHIDAALMDELAALQAALPIAETLLVADAMMGQDAVTVAQSFAARVVLTGVVLTRVDGDARGGAALSMRQVTGCPIKWLGVGEKLDQLEVFHPERLAGRILGQGDVVGLVERAAAAVDQAEAEAMARKMEKGSFDLNDLAKQLQTITKMGGMRQMLTMLPGGGKIDKAVNPAALDDKLVKRQVAMIQAMTPTERRQPKLLNASRKRRIALGSGTQVSELNRLLKQFLDMQTFMKHMQKNKGLLASVKSWMGGR